MTFLRGGGGGGYSVFWGGYFQGSLVNWTILLLGVGKVSSISTIFLGHEVF